MSLKIKKIMISEKAAASSKKRLIAGHKRQQPAQPKTR